MSSKTVVKLLQEAYCDEIETLMNYQANAIILDGVRTEEIKESLRADVQEELAHSKQLGKRLDELNARPPASMEFTPTQDMLQPPAESTSVLPVVEGVIEAEKEAIETYRKLIEAAEEANDPVTEDLAVQLLAEEEAHVTEFRGFRRDLK